jgi:two-component system, LuxR family, sensor kinase FixL
VIVPLEQPARSGRSVAVWLLPLVGVTVLAVCVIGWLLARDRLEDRSSESLGRTATSAAAGTAAALEPWADQREADAEFWSGNPRFLAPALELLAADDDDLVDSPAQAALREIMLPFLELNGYRGYFLIRPDGTSVGSTRDNNIGTENLVHVDQPELFAGALDGASFISRPQVTDVPLEEGGSVDELTMFAGAPVVDAGEVVGVVTLRIDPTESFWPIFEAGSIPDSLELRAYDRDGVVVAPGPPAFGATVDAPSTEPEPTLVTTGDTAVEQRWVDRLYLGVRADVTETAAVAATDEAIRAFDALAIVVFALIAVFTLLVVAAFVRARRHRRELATWAGRLGLVLDHATEAFVVVDEEQRIRRFNEAAEELFGYTADEVRDQPLGLLLPERLRAGHVALVDEFARVTRSDRARMAADRPDVAGRRADGSEFPASVSIGYIDLGDRVILIASIRDRTAEIEASRHAAERAELEARNEELDRVATLAAHDLREPLRTMAVWAELAQEQIADGDSDGAGDALGRIRQSAQRLNRMVGDLLRVSRIGRSEATAETVDAGEVAREVVESHADVIAEHAAEIDIGELPLVECRRPDLASILSNLLVNALKHGGPDLTRISIADGDPRTDGALIEVVDDGRGVPETQQERIFEMFRRLDANVPGSGIGLAESRRIAEANGGRLWVESNGAGARFRLLLPLGNPEALGYIGRDATQPPPGGG